MNKNSAFYRLRMRLGIPTQRAMDKLLGFPNSTIAYYETGARIPKMQRCVEIVKRLRMLGYQVHISDLRDDWYE